MKRFIAVLSGLLVLPAFAEVAPVYYDDVIEYSDDVIDDENIVDEAALPQEQQKPVTQRKTINRSTSASRAISSTTNSATTRANTSTRAVATSPRSTTGTARANASRTAKTSRVVSRVPTTNRQTVTSRNTQTAKPVTARIGITGTPLSANKVSSNIYSTGAQLEDSQVKYSPSGTARVASVGNRRATSRASTSLGLSSAVATPVITEEDVTATTTNLTAITELTDYCKAQYAACMDNYCNVLDDNQGRCSCSKNIKKYAATEAALEKATLDFQDTVQKIKYIGLTSSQVEALFAETEAEMTMGGSSGKDQSKLRQSLDAIKKNIVDVTSPAATSYDVTDGISFDISGLLSADIMSNGFDLSSFLGGNNNNTSNVSNQRGEQLHKTATNRCKTAVLNSCTSQGIDANVITNSYDLEIDKQCMAYERSLNEANRDMRNNVTNAANILQQARLVLAQNKNSYDLRGCVAAIDACMQDEYVCGSDYELCLDPTGKYLANGEIVKGGTPGVSGGQTKNVYPTSCAAGENCQPTGSESTFSNWTSGGMYNLYSTWDYKGDNDNMYNAWSVGNKENLADYVDKSLTKWTESNTYKSTTTAGSDNMAMYLLRKVGYVEKGQVHGMCASVMQQCQDYAFKDPKKKSAEREYIPNNEVVRQYLLSTLAKIKVQQDTILADYAEGCRSDVQSCLSTNGYDESNVSSTASKTAVNACAAEITTCMSVGGYQVSDGVKLTLRAMTDWVASILISCPTNYYLRDDGVGSTTSSGNTSTKCIACPSYNGIQTVSAGGQTTRCSCPDNYSDVTDTEGELIGCTQTSCVANQYLKASQVTDTTVNNSITVYTCTACPEHSHSSAGANDTCICDTGYGSTETGSELVCTANNG